MDLDEARVFTARASCVDCGRNVGEPHDQQCGRARCIGCGLRWLDCSMPEGEGGHGVDLYRGYWPFDAECRMYGWFVRWDADKQRFERCLAGEDGAGPDISRLTSQARWIREAERWMQRNACTYVREGGSGPSTDEEQTLLWWGVSEGFRIVGSYADDGRQGKAWKSVLTDVARKRIEVVLITDQLQLGSSNKVRRRAFGEVRLAGGSVLSMALGGPTFPESYAAGALHEARAAMVVVDDE